MDCSTTITLMTGSCTFIVTLMSWIYTLLVLSVLITMSSVHVCVNEVQQTQYQLRQDWVHLDVNKTAAKEFGSAVLPVGVSAIQPTNGARNLGVLFDNHLDLKKCVSNISRSCIFNGGSYALFVDHFLLVCCGARCMHLCHAVWTIATRSSQKCHCVTLNDDGPERCSTSLRRRVKTKQCSSSASWWITLAVN